MKPLEKTLRNQLERTVKEARTIAEAAAKAALDQLGVGEAKPYSHLTEEDRELRVMLRAHGRQLGDVRDNSTEAQEIDRLVEEVAYEHWHRMLFARFLAENNLLILRETLLSNELWNLVGRLGAQAFQTPMWDFNVQLLFLTKGKKVINIAKSSRLLNNVITSFDLSETHSSNEKALKIINISLDRAHQNKQLSNPGYVITSREIDMSNLLISPTGTLFCTIYTGEYFDDNVQILVPNSNEHILAIWAYCSSEYYNADVREIDQALKVRSALVNVPFDIDHWTKVAAEKYPNGLPKPYSDDPTQWLFHGHPVPSDDPLQVAVARLLGYRLPAELDTTWSFPMRPVPGSRSQSRYCRYPIAMASSPPVRGETSASDRLFKFRRSALRHLRSLEAHREATHRLESGSQRWRPPEHPAFSLSARCG